MDAEDEPRRGASRANSVRFDESALHGHFSRTSTDFLPSRTGSGLGGGSLLLTERTSSHKSDGRHSSAGQSIGSARASNYGGESRPLSATVPSFVPSGPSAGLFILGPVPSIIRCWLTTEFSNDSLLYAAICTGSCKSILGKAMVDQLGLQNQIKSSREGQSTLKLPMYLPEATIQQSSNRSGSPTPQLPIVTIEFDIHDFGPKSEQIQILIGSDVLRARSADIQFSLDRITIFDDERNKLSIPLVRPENAKLFQTLITLHGNVSNQISSNIVPQKEKVGTIPTTQPRAEAPKAEEAQDFDHSTTAPSSVTTNGFSRKFTNGSEISDATISTVGPDEGGTPKESSIEKSQTKSETGSIWGSWRRDSLQNGQSPASRETTTSSSYQRAGRGRGMKILKPARLNTSSSATTSQPPVGFDAAPSRTAGFTTDSKVIAPPASASKPKSANPIGGASAFGWLNSAAKPSATPSGEGS